MVPIELNRTRSQPERPETEPPRLGRRATSLLVTCLAGLVLAPVVFSVSAGTFTPNGTQPPTFYAVDSPTDCSVCHGNYDGLRNIEPFETWKGSMMANAARDPLFWAALDVANHDVPGIGDYCLRCHVPTGWLAGRAAQTDGCGLDGPIDQQANDFEGVSCHFCHRMMENSSPPPGQNSVYFENADFWIDDSNCGGEGEPCRRGPYDYALGGDPPPHAWAFSNYHTSSGFCGNCHNVTNPVLNLRDSSGNDLGIKFPIERTYKEWQQSAFAPAGSNPTNCQGCHMPDATAKEPIFACGFEQNDRNGNLPVHEFVGGNTWIPRVLRDEYPNLGRTAAFNATIAWAQQMLQSAAQVTVSAPPTMLPGENAEVAVRVTNLSGHKLPTGYIEGRRMWLNVQARGANNALLWESGAYNAATGVLTEDAQVKIYRNDSGVWNRNGTAQCDITDTGGNPIFHFALNDCIVIDNRIPPLGFTGGSDLETRPVGYAYPETSPGSGMLVNYDDVTYQVPIPFLAVSPVTITATLYYQTASKEYVEFLRDQAVTHDFPDDCIPRTGGAVGMSRGELMHSLWTTYDRSPPAAMALASDAVVVDNDIFADGFETGNTTAWDLVVP